jgi:Cu2+-exporting ATPase
LWELAALVTIILLGHWQEMKAIGQAQGALAALAALLPDDADRIIDDGTIEQVLSADGVRDAVHDRDAQHLVRCRMSDAI